MVVIPATVLFIPTKVGTFGLPIVIPTTDCHSHESGNERDHCFRRDDSARHRYWVGVKYGLPQAAHTLLQPSNTTNALSSRRKPGPQKTMHKTSEVFFTAVIPAQTGKTYKVTFLSEIDFASQCPSRASGSSSRQQLPSFPRKWERVSREGKVFVKVHINHFRMFSEKLKEETKTNHQSLERLLIPKIKSIKTTEDYLWLLRVFYSYFGALENEINKAVDQQLLPDLAHRRKADLIAQDIKNLGGEVPELAHENMIPRITTHNQALAALYVIEGSALGGQIISKMIMNALGDQAKGSLQFYQGYGEQTQLMWSQFKDAMNSQILSEEEQQAAVELANETFGKFRELAEQWTIDS